MELSSHKSLWVGRSKSGSLYVGPEKPDESLYSELIFLNQAPENRPHYQILEKIILSLLSFTETTMGLVSLLDQETIKKELGPELFPLWNGFLQSLDKTYKEWQDYAQKQNTKKS